MFGVVYSSQHSILIGHFRVSFHSLLLPQDCLARGTNEPRLTLTLSHNTCAPIVTIVLTRKCISNGDIAVDSTKSDFTNTPTSGTLTPTHTIVWTGLDFSLAGLANETNVTKALPEVALPSVIATIGAGQLDTAIRGLWPDYS